MTRFGAQELLHKGLGWIANQSLCEDQREINNKNQWMGLILRVSQISMGRLLYTVHCLYWSTRFPTLPKNLEFVTDELRSWLLLSYQRPYLVLTGHWLHLVPVFSVCQGGLEAPCNNHGNCSDGILGSGKCVCQIGFRGTACELCLRGFYGPNCKRRSTGFL